MRWIAHLDGFLCGFVYTYSSLLFRLIPQAVLNPPSLRPSYPTLQVDLTVDKFSLTRLDQIHHTGTLAHIQQLEAGAYVHTPHSVVQHVPVSRT